MTARASPRETLSATVSGDNGETQEDASGSSDTSEDGVDSETTVVLSYDRCTLIGDRSSETGLFAIPVQNLSPFDAHITLIEPNPGTTTDPDPTRRGRPQPLRSGAW